MAVNRFVLNNISYHGAGAIKEIPGEITRRGYKKAFVCSDPDLVKFGVTAKVTNELDAAGIPWTLYSEIKPNPTIQNVKDGVEAYKASGADMHGRHRRRLLHGHLPRASASSLRTPSSPTSAPSRALPTPRSTPRSPSPSPPRPAPPLRSRSTT